MKIELTKKNVVDALESYLAKEKGINRAIGAERVFAIVLDDEDLKESAHGDFSVSIILD